jgi:hypothetical protein
MRSARQGNAGQGGGVPGASAVGAGGSARDACETPQGRGTRSSVPQTTRLVGATGRMTAR